MKVYNNQLIEYMNDNVYLLKSVYKYINIINNNSNNGNIHNIQNNNNNNTVNNNMTKSV